MAFNAETFMENVTWESFDELKKPELMTLAKHLNLEVKHAMRKQVIKNMLIDRLVEDDLLSEFDLDNKIDLDDGADSAVKLKQLEFQQEMEMAKLQLEKEKLQIQEQERQEKLQLEKEKLDLEKALKQQELDAKLQFEQKEREDRLAMEK